MNMRTMAKYILLCIVCFAGGAKARVISPNNSKKNTAFQLKPNGSPTPENEDWITVFVHGTMGLRELAGFKTFITLFREDVCETWYGKKCKQLRHDPRSYNSQAAQGIGLLPINTKGKPENAASLFAQGYDLLQNTYFPHQNNIGYYTYGWSGIVNCNERFEESIKMYQALARLMADLKKDHPHLKLRVFCYSHGANVTLNLAQVAACMNLNVPDFHIDELISIAVPVQRSTDCFVADPFFKKVYSLYSRWDYVQKMDMFSFNRFFSDRKFFDNARCLIPSNVKQIEMRVTVAAENDLKQPYPSKKRINRSPGHLELWLYGWPGSTRLYRSHFPLVPFPAALLAPAIISTVDTHCTNQTKTVVEVQPDTGNAVMRALHSHKKQTVPLIKTSLLETLKRQAWEFYNRVIKPRNEITID